MSDQHDEIDQILQNGGGSDGASIIRENLKANAEYYENMPISGNKTLKGSRNVSRCTTCKKNLPSVGTVCEECAEKIGERLGYNKGG